MSRLQLCVALFAIPCSAALGQAAPVPPARADTGQTGRPIVVTGTVFDSLSRVPLAGALVEMSPEAGGADRVYSATSDSAGTYRMAGVPQGRYLATFFHHALDSAGVRPSTRRVRIGPDSITRVDLAMPSARTIWTASCHPASATDSSGLLFGTVHDAETQAVVPRSAVAVSWYELVLGTHGLRSELRQKAARADSMGHYALCGIPAGPRVGVRAERAAAASGILLVQIPPRGIREQDIAIGVSDSTIVVAADAADSRPNDTIEQRGTARLVGTVQRAPGAPVHGAHVVVLGMSVQSTTDAHGGFALTGLRPGSYTLEARYLGYEPQDVVVNLVNHRTTAASLTLDTPVPTLHAVTIYGKPPRRDPYGFYERKSKGWGHYFTRADMEQRFPLHLSDMLTNLPGVRVVQSGQFNRRVVMNAGQTTACVPDVYVDGVRLALETRGNIDAVLSPEDVAGMEVYTNHLEVPFDFRDPTSDCGIIVVWTRLGEP